jgi:hypothetical protein
MRVRRAAVKKDKDSILQIMRVDTKMNVHEPKDLAVLITAEVHSDNAPQNVVVMIWRDCTARVTFPSGAKMDAGPGRNLDTTIQMAIAGIHHSNEGPKAPKIELHRVPPELTTNEQILAWMETLSGIAVELTTNTTA